MAGALVVAALTPALGGCGLVLGIEELSPEVRGGWSRSFGETGAQDAADLALTAGGALVVAGVYQGAIEFGGSRLPEAGDQAFLASFDAGSAVHRWSMAVPNVDQGPPPSLRLEADGAEIVVAGGFEGRISLANKLLQANSQDALVARFSEGGQASVAMQLGGAGDQPVFDVAVQAGEAVLAGGFLGSLDFGGGAAPTLGGQDAFAAKLAGADLAYVWQQTFGGAAGDDRAERVAIGPAGEVVLAGPATGDTSFGGSTYSGGALFVATLGSGGQTGWLKRFGEPGDQITGVALDPAGNVILAGHFSGALDLGQLLASGGEEDIFLIKLDGQQGEHLWSRAFGGPGSQRCRALHLDPSGAISLTGELLRDVNFGGDTLTSEGGIDVFVARLDGEGQHLWSERFGDSDDQHGEAVVADAAGNLYLAGHFQGEIDFGHGPLRSRSSADLFVAKLAPPEE